MELVVDTNILYTFFWKNSFARKFLMKMSLELYSPEFALVEINKHESDILEKTGISHKEFKELKGELAIAVNFVPLDEYESLLKSALSFSPDPNDIDFFALAMKLKLQLWSNDPALKKQNKVEVFSTSDLLNKPEFVDVLFPDE